MTHLLKSPFCVHPRTGKIGVPIDPATVDQFDPHKVPAILDLMDEIDMFDLKARGQGMPVEELKKIRDIEKTSLNKYLCIFHNFLNDLGQSYVEEM